MGIKLKSRGIEPVVIVSRMQTMTLCVGGPSWNGGGGVAAPPITVIQPVTNRGRAHNKIAHKNNMYLYCAHV